MSEEDGLEEFVVPEDVGLRAGAFGGDAVGEADCLGGFDVEDGANRDAGLLGEAVEDGFSENLVDGGVDDDVGFAAGTAGEEEDENQ